MDVEEKTELQEQYGSEDEQNTEKVKRKRNTHKLPALSFEESLEIANAIWQYASGKRIRRITLFDQIDKSPDCNRSRTLITSSAKYGITTGSYAAEYIELTPDGAAATNPDESAINQVPAQFNLAIKGIEEFFKLYSQYKDMKLPSKSVMIDYLKEQGLNDEDSATCVELFIVNATYIGIIQVKAGSERILNLDQVCEEIPTKQKTDNLDPDVNMAVVDVKPSNTNIINNLPISQKWENTCFYITPIGNEESEERKHSDLFLNSIVEPALSGFD